jgi:hypothetical protein
MMRVTIAIMLMVVAVGLTFVFYTKSGEVSTQTEVWNRAGSGFELTSLHTTNPTPTQTQVWNRAGSGFELSSQQATSPASEQK